MIALKTIQKYNILQPLLVLEILKNKQSVPAEGPKMRYIIVKTFLCDSMKAQMKRIEKHKTNLAR